MNQTTNQARTLGELREQGYTGRSVKTELRDNLLNRLASELPIFPGIVGYDESVIPQIENAILAGQDMCFLGERGQAKTRLARLLVGLLDEYTPIVAGSELNDDPLAPISPTAIALVEAEGDQTPIEWLPRDRRYTEKLATPDITIADLIGEVDPIKVAEGRYLADASTIHYGLVPRANRGIFALNELPDLAERIQVGLLNVLEERDVQVRGYTLRLPLDLFVVASANPEDYTSRGRIITPLKDRLGSQVRTHYPRTVEDEISIMLQERTPLIGEGIPVLTEPAVHARAHCRADAAGPALPGGQPAVGRQRAGEHRQPRDARRQRRKESSSPRRARCGAAHQRPAGARCVDGRKGGARDSRRRDARGSSGRPTSHASHP